MVSNISKWASDMLLPKWVQEIPFCLTEKAPLILGGLIGKPTLGNLDQVFTWTLCRMAIRNLLQPDGVTFKTSIELLINMQWPQDKDLFIPDGIKLYDNTTCVQA